MRLIDSNGTVAGAEPNAVIVRLVAQAHRLWTVLRTERIDITRLAEREGMSGAYLTRVLRLAFLAPVVTEAILAGSHPVQLTAHRLTLGEGVPADWGEQVGSLLNGNAPSPRYSHATPS